MKFKFHDNYGSKDTVYFSPEIEVFKDGSIVMLATDVYIKGVKYEIPAFAGDSDCLWLDPSRGTYDNQQLYNEPGTFKVVWKEKEVINIARYKEVVSDESFFQKIMRKLRAFA